MNSNTYIRIHMYLHIYIYIYKYIFTIAIQGGHCSVKGEYTSEKILAHII
jgi:hypothetical protein